MFINVIKQRQQRVAHMFALLNNNKHTDRDRHTDRMR